MLVKNCLTKEIKEYDTMMACANDFNTGKTTICYRLKTKGKVKYNNHLFCYKEELDSWLE